MDFSQTTLNFQTRVDIFSFFLSAIGYREKHKDQSEQVALYVFNVTHKNKLGILYSDDIDAIRNEFGALEAPGQPDDNTEPDVFVDHLWDRLRAIIEKSQK